ncbi:Bilirubin oxidase [Geobacter metallireducens RCH3]|uniref:Multicopper oxidase n=1 Tax=Geobacter metallireducens (strain ATCC 53774 / DSM 7210 / GS-15) TaxID=269799 RepID=Q39TP0_GEOMG|nr:multicopper oxidase [Geobacter metallireducens]ABB32384.1 multicopper oxidase [Geobacter metallireducens GS-15]EHP86726.1 Bilirubin oxidase [Geobacter metallireducens RCH3]
MDGRSLWRGAVAAGITLALGIGNASASFLVPQTALPGKNVPKYRDPLPTFAGSRVPATSGYTVSFEEFKQQVLPASGGFGPTTVWGYKINGNGPLWPGYTVEATKGSPATATYVNNLAGPGGTPPLLQKYLTVDQTIHWADPFKLRCMFTPMAAGCFDPYTGPVPAVAHLHGGEDKSDFDGGPEQWFTPNGMRGPAYRTYTSAGAPPAPANGAVYNYPNGQEATTLWFHDHALGTTRLNVYGGLAAFYFLRDDRDTGRADNPIRLPAGDQETEILIQDRQFDTAGQLLFPDGFPSGLNGAPPNPTVHPFWIPEFFGDVIVVNGKSWPYQNVEPRRYRLRLLNGSNARFYNLAFIDGVLRSAPIWQIGTDGGLLDAPVPIVYPGRLLLAPGERADVIVDFTPFAGKTVTLTNNAKAPFPSGMAADPQTTAQIMQFRVGTTVTGDTDGTCDPAASKKSGNKCVLRTTPMVKLATAKGTTAPGVTVATRRQLVLREIEGGGGPLEVLLNNTKWSGIMESTMGTTNTPVAGSTQLVDYWLTELPTLGSTEVWEIINTTGDAHPIHLHLVQFQIMNRQPYQANKYLSDWMAALTAAGKGPGDGPPNPYATVLTDTLSIGGQNQVIGGNLLVTPYLQGSPVPAAPNEQGWKDTVVMMPGEVTRIAVRFSPQGNPIGGSVGYSFDATDGPGYVWHCHILDHEDNEMMRPYIPVKP